MKRFKELLQPSLVFTSIIQLAFPIFLFIGINLNVSMGWWILSLFGIFFYIMIGNNIGFHRYFTHSHFQTNKIVEWIFFYAGTMIGFGGPISYAITHLVHHRYSDTEHDPHGPIRGKRSWLVYYQKLVDLNESPLFNRRIVYLSKKYQWSHDYYIPLIILNALILILIDFKLFLFFWAIPASFSCWVLAFAVWRQHAGLEPQNDWFHWFDILNEGLHKNHHINPSAPNTAFSPKEIDWTYQFSRLLFPRFSKKD